MVRPHKSNFYTAIKEPKPSSNSESHHGAIEEHSFKISTYNTKYLNDIAKKSAFQQKQLWKALADPMSVLRLDYDDSFLGPSYKGMSNKFMNSKTHVNAVVIGPLDSGKSTLTGHLLCHYKVFDESLIEGVANKAAEMKKDNLKYAWLLDRHNSERELGITKKISFGNFQTDDNDFTIVDAPGHGDFDMSMVSVIQADCVVLIIDSTTGAFEDGILQTKEHALLAFSHGVKQIICCLNKMDATVPNYSKRRYDIITKEVFSILREVGFSPESITFLPVSGFEGDNMFERSTNLGWYKGPTLIKALNSVIEPKRPVKRPLRLPLLDVHNIGNVGTVPVGRVETGVLKAGMMVEFGPIGLSARVNTVQRHHKSVSEAFPGDFVGFSVPNIAVEDLKCGYVASDFEDDPAKRAVSFTAHILISNHPGEIRNGYVAVLYCHALQSLVKFDSILCKINRQSGNGLKDPEFLIAGDEGIVKMIPSEPIVVEPYTNYPPLGRIVLRDGVQTVAVGVVLSVENHPI